MPIEQLPIEHSESPGGRTQVILVKSQLHNRSANDSCMPFRHESLIGELTPVGTVGFEPITFGSQNRCATKLRHIPLVLLVRVVRVSVCKAETHKILILNQPRMPFRHRSMKFGFSPSTLDRSRTCKTPVLSGRRMPFRHKGKIDRRLVSSHNYPPDSLVRYRT
jgi:hypothetical protein